MIWISVFVLVAFCVSGTIFLVFRSGRVPSYGILRLWPVFSVKRGTDVCGKDLPHMCSVIRENVTEEHVKLSSLMEADDMAYMAMKSCRIWFT